MTLDDFAEDKFGDSLRPLLADFLLFPVPGRDSLSDSSEDESCTVLVGDSLFVAAELALEDFAEVCFELI